jgi:serine/threonine-protein kinase RsbW
MDPATPAPVRMEILSDPENLPIVRAEVERLCEQVGFDADRAGHVMLSVDEALTNIIRHAYEGRDDGRIDVEFEPLGGATPTGLCIRLRDYGRTVDLSKIKSRDLTDVRPGGLGVHIMQQCMDDVQYAHADGGGTLLTLCKHLGGKKRGCTP